MVLNKWFHIMIMRSENEDNYDDDTEESHHTFSFPDDILIEILSRVPADRLEVFKRVCPNWKVLISSYDFCKLHLKRAKDEAIKKSVVFVEYSKETSESSRQAIWLANLVGILKQGEVIDTNAIGSCDGLLMFRIQPTPKILIVNPITQETRIITSPNKIGSTCIFFDRFEDDYKLLHLFPDRGNGLYDYIYSFNKDEWTRLNSVKTRSVYLPSLDGSPILVNDALHWICYSSISLPNMVLVFKIETKDFSLCPHPSGINANCWLSIRPFEDLPGIRYHEPLQFIEKDGQLCLCHTIIEPNYNVIEIWVLQNYGDWGSWAKKFKVDLSCGIDGCSKECLSSIKIVSFNHDDDAVLLAWPNRGLYLYNLETMEIKLIKEGSYDCTPLIKTLLSPNNVYTTLQQEAPKPTHVYTTLQQEAPKQTRVPSLFCRCFAPFCCSATP